MTRRLLHALSITGLALLTLGASPAPIGGLKPVALVYRQVEGTFLKGPRGVFVDAGRGDVYVADTMNDLVAVYDLQGTPRFAFGYNGEVKEPVKAVADDGGRIYVLASRAIKVFNYRGEYLEDFSLHGVQGEVTPTALTVHAGALYVGDSTGARILVYEDDRLKRTIAGADGRLRSITALSVAADGAIYVADASGPMALQVYGADGRFLRGWGQHQSGPQNFSLPSGVTLDGQGRVIAVDMIRQQISVFTTEGVFQGRFGGLGTAPGAVAYPSDIASDRNGRLYVVERRGNRLQILEQQQAPPGRRRAPAPAAPAAVREEMRRAIGDFMRGRQ